MTENRTKTKLNKFVALFMAICIFTCCLYGCDKGEDGGEKPTASKPTSSGEKATGSYSHTDKSDQSDTTKADDKTEKDETTKKSGSKESTKKSSTGGTTKKSNSKGTTKKSGSKGTTATKTTAPPPPSTTKSNTYYAPQVYYNSAPGTLVLTSSDGAATVDYSNTSSGYCMIKYAGAFSNLRSRFTGPNGVTQQYSFPADGGYHAIPLTGGSGTYTFDILGNNGGTSYSVVMNGSFNASLSYSTVAFSRPNINVNYGSGTSCVQYAATLTRGCDTDLLKVRAIYNYVVSTFSYDRGKAASVANAAYIPNLNAVWASKSGICYDYASTMAAMLRTQGIPTKVEVGYVNSSYHAWISCYVKEAGWIDNIIQFNGNSWKLMDPTFASTGGSNVDWAKRSSYQVKYLY